MRIAQVAPLIESVPPPLYGGTERVVSYLTEELVRQGHEVVLFATKDSQTSARLMGPDIPAIRGRKVVDTTAPHIEMLGMVQERAREFDVIHYHVDYLHFPMSRLMGVPHATTLHGRLDIPELQGIYAAFPDMPVISISDFQRRPLPHASWRGTVYHGLPSQLYHLEERPGDYLAFLGRISPEKRLDRAIEIAAHAKMRLRVAAKVDPSDEEYFHKVIEPLLCQEHVEFLGEITDAEKNSFLGGARALIFPIDWPEPFGLVMIEAMACGTPVIAMKGGSVAEIVEQGLTGYIVETVSEAALAAKVVSRVDRRACRRRFEERFSASRMAKDYVELFEELISEKRKQCPITSSGWIKEPTSLPPPLRAVTSPGR